MNMPRIFTSSKFQAAFVASALSIGGWIFSITDKNLDRPHKLEATQTAIKFICLTWFAAIGGTALEDAAAKKGCESPSDPISPVTAQAPTAGANQQAVAQIVAQILAHFQQPNKTQPNLILPPLNQGPKT